MPVKVYSLLEVLSNSQLLLKWIDFEAVADNLYSMYGSVDWLSSLGSYDDSFKVLFFLDDHQTIKNIVPLKIQQKEVSLFPIALFPITTKLSTANVVANVPFGEVSSSNYTCIFQQILEIDRLECINIKSIYVDSSAHRKIKAAIKALHPHIMCIESLPREFHTLALKASFESYLAMFSKKERYNLRRQCRLAKEASGGCLELRAITTEQDIDFFASSSRNVLDRSWKSHLGEAVQFFSEQNCREYVELARKGILRSYILLGNNKPWAFVLGYQWKGIFHYANISYDNTYAHLSPGTVLFYLMLEDLHMHDKPSILNFGIGESFYKRRFGTDTYYDCSIIVMKMSIKNKFIHCCLAAMNKLRSIKKYLKTVSVKQNNRPSGNGL